MKLYIALRNAYFKALKSGEARDITTDTLVLRLNPEMAWAEYRLFVENKVKKLSISLESGTYVGTPKEKLADVNTWLLERCRNEGNR